MAAKILRGVIVGVSTSLGNELSEELNGAAPAWHAVVCAAEFAALGPAKPVQ